MLKLPYAAGAVKYEVTRSHPFKSEILVACTPTLVNRRRVWACLMECKARVRECTPGCRLSLSGYCKKRPNDDIRHDSELVRTRARTHAKPRPEPIALDLGGLAAARRKYERTLLCRMFVLGVLGYYTYFVTNTTGYYTT